MAAKDTFSKQTLITKTPVNGHAVASGGQTGFGARARARHPSREEGKDKKKNCLLCRPGLTQGWLGWAIFSRVFRLSQKAAKTKLKTSRRLDQVACVQTSPISFVPFPRATKEIGDVCTQATTKLSATFGDRVFILATGNKHKIQRWRDGGPFQDVFVFSDIKVCSHYLHALRGNNLIQESFVTFFVSFLTDVLIGSCFLPQQYSPARINVFARVLVTLTVHYSILFNPTVVQSLYLYDIFPPSSIKLF